MKRIAPALLLSFACAAPANEVEESAAYLVAEEEDIGEEILAGMPESEIDEVADETLFKREHRATKGMCGVLLHGKDPDFDVTRPDSTGKDKTHRKYGHAKRRLFWLFDEDGDGVLDDSERDLLVDTMREVCRLREANRLAEFDADGDGELSKDEKELARQAHQARRDLRRQRRIDAADTNDDGKVSDEEKKAFKEEKKRLRAERRAAYDTNMDGTLDAAELARARADWIARVRGEVNN